MTEARRLLRELADRLGHEAGCSLIKDAACDCEMSAVTVYLAQPMTKCEEREGELVAALKLAKHKAEQIRDGQSNPEQRARAIIQVAAGALAQTCDTCKGTRVAPVADEDLGGEGITMSSCPDCVLE